MLAGRSQRVQRGKRSDEEPVRSAGYLFISLLADPSINISRRFRRVHKVYLGHKFLHKKTIGSDMFFFSLTMFPEDATNPHFLAVAFLCVTYQKALQAQPAPPHVGYVAYFAAVF